MPVLPTRDSLGGVPSVRPTGGVARPDTTGIGRGLANLGEGISAAGAVLTAGWKAAQEAEAQSKYLQWQFDETQQLETATRELSPEQAGGFATSYMAGVRERVKPFLDELPDSVRAEYGNKSFAFAASELHAGALSAERAGQSRHGVNVSQEFISKGIGPQARLAAARDTDQQRSQSLAAIRAQIDEFYASDKLLSALDRDEQLQKAYEEADLQFDGGLPLDQQMLLDPAALQAERERAVAEAMARLPLEAIAPL